MVNRIWPAYVAGWSWQRQLHVSFACHSSGPNSVNPGQILLVYGKQKSRYLSHFFNGFCMKNQWTRSKVAFLVISLLLCEQGTQQNRHKLIVKSNFVFPLCFNPLLFSYTMKISKQVLFLKHFVYRQQKETKNYFQHNNFLLFTGLPHTIG